MGVLDSQPAKRAVMDAQRRERCERAHATLAQALAEQVRSPAYHVFRCRKDGDPDLCAAALEYFDRESAVSSGSAGHAGGEAGGCFRVRSGGSR